MIFQICIELQHDSLSSYMAVVKQLRGRECGKVDHTPIITNEVKHVPPVP